MSVILPVRGILNTAPKSRSDAAQPAAKKPSVANPWYIPKTWSGMTLAAWVRLLRQHPGKISPAAFGHVAAYCGTSLVNSALGAVQSAVYGRRIARMHVEPPLFILGHWRSGTTLLHELLVRDPGTTFPSIYHCAAPSHSLLTERIVVPLLGGMMPKKRPQDDMELGLVGPQEEDLGLTNLGMGNPYTRLAFPNESPADDAYYELDDLTDDERRRWLDGLYRFFQTLQFRAPGKRIVAKSPPQTMRVPWLVERFPDARFIHIVRNPYSVLPSTEHFWRSLAETQSLQKPQLGDLRGDVIAMYLRMMRRFDDTRHLIPRDRLIELRYEDLVANPLGVLEDLYASLDLPGFDSTEPGMERYLAEHSDYRTNRFQIAAAFRERITRECGEYLRRWNYLPPEPASRPRAVEVGGCPPVAPPVTMPVPIVAPLMIG